MKNELGEKIMINFVGIKSKTYSYLINDGSKEKKGKGAKNYAIKRTPKFENYKNYLELTQLDDKGKYLEKKST